LVVFSLLCKYLQEYLPFWTIYSVRPWYSTVWLGTNDPEINSEQGHAR
jgi:hypothetical protein